MHRIEGSRIARWILVPALISLAVTLLRLIGELNRWSPTLFNREAGGPGAIVGIVWLAPIFGIYFAIRLSRSGYGPPSRGRAIAFALSGVVVFALLAFLGSRFPGPLGRIVAINAASALAAVVAARGWPDLGRVELAYGLAARIPVAVIMLVAMNAQWGTHYELGPPGLPPMGVVATWLWVGLLPQMVFWIGFTVLAGSLFGTMTLLVVRSPASPEKTGSAVGWGGAA